MKRLLFLVLFSVLCVSYALAQKTIKGKVTDASDGMGLPGVNVIVKGTTVGTATDIDGNYTLSVPASATTLVFTSVGMTVKEVAISGSTMNISLMSDSEMVDEVMVVAYGTTKKSSFTGSAAVVSDKELSKMQTTDVAKSLEGIVPGLSVVSESGQPGQDTKLRIRGIGSINASSEPLIIVDGAPYDGQLSSINSNDIQSVSVLKDAASAALYGARGANGVILISTKRGTSGKTSINFDAKLGYNYRGVSEYDIMDSPQEYYETFWEALYNQGIYASGLSDAEAKTYASSADGLYKVLGYNIYNVDNDKIVLENGQLNPDAKVKYPDSDWNDWEGKLYSPQLRQQYDLSLTKGDENNKVFFSLGYLNDKGYNESTDFTRYSSRIAYDSKFFPWLDFNTSAQFSMTSSNWSQTGGSYTNTFQWTRSIAPIYPIYQRDANGNILKDDKGNNVYDFGEAVAGVNGARAYGALNNPVATQNEDIDQRENYYFTENTNLKIKLPYDFSLTSNATIYGNWYSRNRYTTPIGGSGLQYNGISNKWKDRTITFNWNQILRWEKEFEDFSIQAMLGHETYSKNFHRVFGEKSNYVNPDNSEWANASKIADLTSYNREYKLEGYFGQVTGDYKDRYFFSASLRRDGSSVFHPDNRWGTFWSLGASWRMSEEEFLADADFLDNLKLKASYGAQGNDYLYLPNTNPQLRAYTPYQTLYQITSDGENPGIEPKYLGNEEVTWEKNLNFNVGLEFALFDRFVSGEFEYFKRQTEDLLFNLPVPTSTGFTTKPVNIGSMENVGWEALLNFNIIRKENLRWSLGLNASQFKNEITSLPDEFKEEGITRGSQRITEGGSIYDFYLVKYAGVDSENGDALYWLKDKNDEFVKTPSEDYSITGNLQYAGSSIPDFQGGFFTTLEVHNFDLSAQFSYQVGGQMLDLEYERLMHEGGGGDNWHTDIRDRWTEDNKDSDIPRIQYNNQNLLQRSDRFLTDASYLSFRNFTLGYTFSESMLSKIKLQGLRIYFVADNIALWSKRKGMDPRVAFSGINDESLYSPIRTTSFGLSLTL